MKSSENYFCRKNCIKAIERKTKLVCFLGHSHFLSIVHKFSLSHTNDFWNFKMFIKKNRKIVFKKKKKKSQLFTQYNQPLNVQEGMSWGEIWFM